jgi:hypothetical protein
MLKPAPVKNLLGLICAILRRVVGLAKLGVEPWAAD